MARKQLKVSRRMLFTWFMLAGFIFLFAPQSLTSRFQLAFARVFHLPLSIGRNLSLSTRTRQQPWGYEPLGEMQYQNHIANLEAQLLEKHKKIELLQGIRDRLYDLEDASLMAADVVAAFTDGPRNELIINRGAKDGLSAGQFVLGCNSIIGTVSSVGPRTAGVRLITDQLSKTAVTIAKLKIERVMYGTGGNSAKIQMVSKKHKIKAGQSVYACRKQGTLDAPMITAKVAQCKADDSNPLLWDITVVPACDVKRLDTVAVIIMNPEDK